MDDRSVRLRLVWLSLLVLVALAAFNATLHPLVQSFGLAHSRWLESDFRPVFVVDNIAREDVGALLEIYPAEIRGQRAFRVYEILLPSLILALAMGVLSHYLARHFLATVSWLWQRRPRLSVPPLSMWSGLALGCLTGISFGADWRFPRETVLMPFVLAVLGTAAVSMRWRPEAGKLSFVLTGLAAARWFWLGFLALSWRADVLGCPAIHLLAPLESCQLTPFTVATLSAAFLIFHWATRAPARVSLALVTGDRSALIATCDRLTQVAVQELWILLPTVLWTIAHYPKANALPLLCQYLLASAACSALTRWTLEGHPPGSQSVTGRLLGSLCRAGTVALIVSLPLLVLGDSIFDGLQVPIAVPFVLIGLGLVRGQPWRTQKSACDFAVRTQPVQPLGLPVRKRPWDGQTRRAAFAAAIALAITLVSGAHEDWSADRWSSRDNQVKTASEGIADAFGYRARYLRQGGDSLILARDLTMSERARAESIVRDQFPNDRIFTVSVSLWRWELAGFGILVFTLASVLSGLPVILMRKAPGPALTMPFTLLAGANGAFALGAKWGWYWLDPYAHLVAFGLCTVMAGAGVSWARRPAAARPEKQPGEVEPLPETGVETKVLEPVPEPGTKPEVERPKPETVDKLMKVDPLSLEVGRGLIDLVDNKKGAPLLERMTSIRRHVATELGLIVPGIRIRDSRQLKPDTYVIKVREIEVAKGQVFPGMFMAIGPEDRLEGLEGTVTVDPTYGMPGKWIAPGCKAKAEGMGCMIFDPVSVIATQLTEVIRHYASELVTLETIGNRLQSLDQEMPWTVAAVREKHSLLTLREVYRALLLERVSVRDDETILNALAGSDGPVDNLLAEARVALRRSICKEYANNENVINVIGLEPALEKELLGCLRHGALPEGSLEKYGDCFAAAIETASKKGLQPILLAHPRLRLALFRMLGELQSLVVVLATNEITREVKTSLVTCVVAAANPSTRSRD